MSESGGGVRIKVCGLTNLADAQVAMEAGADLLGFIFYEQSPRRVTAETVRAIVDRLAVSGKPLPSSLFPRPPSTIRYVGVFVNTPARQVAEILDFCGLHLAQLHGEEGPDFWQTLAGRAFKAIRPASAGPAQREAARFGGLGPAAGPDLLVDAFHPALRGGTGDTADWDMAAALARRHRLLLAGGLNAHNVADAIRQVQPWGVDVGSGVEAAPGRKDHVQVHAFVKAARSRLKDPNR